MRFWFLRLFIPACLLLFVWSSCRTSKHTSYLRKEQPARQHLTSSEQQLFNELYHEALICYECGNYDSYRELLIRALEIDSTAAEALWTLAHLEYVFAERHDSLQRQKALELARKAAYYQPQDLDIQNNLARMLDSEGHPEEALECFKRMAELHPTQLVQLQLADSYKKLQKYREALDVYNRIERQSGLTKDIIKGKLLVYTELKDSLPLFSFIDTLISEYPNDYEYQIIKGHCYATLYERNDLALSIYNDILRVAPSNQRAQYALLSHYIQTAEPDNIFETVKSIVNNEHIDERERAELLLDYTQDCNLNDTLRLYAIKEFLDTLTYSETATGDISAVHVGLLHALQASPDSILLAVHNTLRFQPENSAVRHVGIYQYYVTENPEGLIQLSEEGQYYDPQTIDYYYYPAEYAILEGDTDKALSILERGLPYYMKSENDSLASDIYAMMGDLYHMQNKLENCFAAYDSALALVPDNPLVLNNYAYFLSLEGEHLEKAQTMAHRANELSPDNATYLDTYAWVLYQAGQYTQAQIYIDQALEVLTEEETSSTYYQHAGDIYWKLGERNKARKFWKLAREALKNERE